MCKMALIRVLYGSLSALYQGSRRTFVRGWTFHGIVWGFKSSYESSVKVFRGSVLKVYMGFTGWLPPRLRSQILKGSWDLVTRVTNKVTILIITYNPN